MFKKWDRPFTSKTVRFRRTKATILIIYVHPPSKVIFFYFGKTYNKIYFFRSKSVCKNISIFLQLCKKYSPIIYKQNSIITFQFPFFIEFYKLFSLIF